MSEGLRWDIEFGDKSQPAVTAANRIDRLIDRVDKADQHTKRFQEHHGNALDELKEKAEQLGHQWTYAARGLKEFAEFTGLMFIYEMTEKIVDKVIELGEEIVKTAAQEERSQKSFALLFGKEEGERQLRYLDEVGAHTEFTRERLKKMSQDMARVGFSGSGLDRARAAALDIAAFSSNAEEGLSGAVGALERVKRTGRVDNRTLGGLGLGEKDFLAELSRRTGQGVETLKKQLDKGKVDTEDALEALYTIITRRTGKALGGAGGDMERTLAARITHLKELPERFFEGFAHAPGFEKISDFLGRVTDAFDPESEFGHKVQENIDEIVDRIGGALGEIDIEHALTAVLDILHDLPDAVAAVTDTFKDMGTALGPVVDAVKVVSSLFEGDQKEAELEAYAKHPEVFQRQRELRNQLAFARASQKAGLGFDVPEFMSRPGHGAGQGMARGMDKESSRVEDAGKRLGGAAEKGVRDRLDMHSPSVVFEDLGALTAEGFARGFARGEGAIDDAVARGIGIPAAKAGGTRGGTVTVNVPVTINVSGAGDAVALATELAGKLHDLVVTEMQSAFEQLEIETGAA